MQGSVALVFLKRKSECDTRESVEIQVLLVEMIL